MLRKKMGIYLFALCIILTLCMPTKVFAANDEDDESEDNTITLTTKSSNNQNYKNHLSIEDIFQSQIPIEDDSSLNLINEDNIKTTQSQYLINREKDINVIQEQLTHYFIINGDKENPIYIYSNKDLEKPSILGKITSIYINSNENPINIEQTIEFPVDIETLDENGKTITTTQIVTNTVFVPQWYEISLDNDKKGYINIKDTALLSDVDNLEYYVYDILYDITHKDIETNDSTQISLLNDSFIDKIPNISKVFEENKQLVFDELGMKDYQEVYPVKTSYLTSKEPMYMTQEEIDQLRVDIVNYAKQFIGNPYVRGGTDPVNGADCSGFVMTIYKHFGIDIYRLEQAQANCGKRVTKAELKPGDLVFYTNEYGYIGHVAIYIGNGQILHASNPKPYPSGGIKVSNLEYGTQILAMTNVLQY